MESTWRQTKPLTVGFIIYFVAVGVVDSSVILTFNNTAIVPGTINETIAQTMLLSLIQIDGILLGFIGAGYAAILGRGHERSAWVRLTQSMPFLLSAGFLFLAINGAFLGLAGTAGLASSQFALLTSYSFNGIISLLFGVFALDEIKTVVERLFGGARSGAADAPASPPVEPPPGNLLESGGTQGQVAAPVAARRIDILVSALETQVDETLYNLSHGGSLTEYRGIIISSYLLNRAVRRLETSSQRLELLTGGLLITSGVLLVFAGAGYFFDAFTREGYPVYAAQVMTGYSLLVIVILVLIAVMLWRRRFPSSVLRGSTS